MEAFAHGFRSGIYAVEVFAHRFRSDIYPVEAFAHGFRSAIYAVEAFAHEFCSIRNGFGIWERAKFEFGPFPNSKAVPPQIRNPPLLIRSKAKKLFVWASKAVYTALA